MEQESQILEINLISAQGLKPPCTHIGRLQTYAVLWVDSSEKLRTRVDNLGGGNPTWNDKFLFRVSPDFITGDTSGVSVDIFSVGHFKDSLVGSVRFLLGNCLGKYSVVNGVKGTPAFTAVLIQRQSGKFEGVLNVAMAFYSSEDFELMSGLNAVCFRDLMSGEKRRRRLSRIGSLRSQKWSGGDDYCDFDMLGSLDLSEGGDSTTLSSSTASSILKDWNGLRKEGVKRSTGGGLLCGLMLQRRIPLCPSDNNLESGDESLEDEVGPCKHLDDPPSTLRAKCSKRSTDEMYSRSSDVSEIPVDLKREMGRY